MTASLTLYPMTTDNTQYQVLITPTEMTFENIVENGENDGYWHFLFQYVFYPCPVFFYAPASKDRGHIVLQLSVCSSVCLHKLNMIFPLLLN